ncbi:NUDIX domain-containing protein [Candidatus Kaiserbacteria bacterium]|nr:NUDIX domain-containing protein [Candidatus Kaiserbacteria bacterium]
MAAHIHDKIDFTAEVFIVCNSKVLLRRHDKYGIWLSVGGHIELDEDPVEAAIREAKEEVGLDIELWDSRLEDASDDLWREVLPPVAIGRHRAKHPTNPDHEHVILVYFAKSTSDAVIPQKHGDKSDEWKWFSAEDLDREDIRPNVRAYAKRALRTLST